MLPEKNGGVIASLSVVSAPAESLRIHGKVLAHSQDGEGQTLRIISLLGIFYQCDVIHWLNFDRYNI